MSEKETPDLSPEEVEELAYLAAFAEENKGSSAGSEESETGESDDDELLPDGKVSEKDAKPASSKSDASDSVTTDAAEDPYAWIEKLPPEARKQARALQHSAQSDAGRLAALQRRVTEAETRLQAVQATQSKGRTTPSQGTATKEDKELSPKLKEFVDSYPQLAESVREMVKQERAELEDLIDQRITPLNQETTFRRLNEARTRLEEGAARIFDTAKTKVHYTDVLKSDLYKEQFLKSQPAEFQQMAATTQDPDTALWVLQQFASFAEKYAEEHGLTDGAPSSSADKANERRRASKASARTVTSRSAMTDPEDSLDYEALFKRMNSPR